LHGEYNVDAAYDPSDIFTARWLTFPDEATRKAFMQREASGIAMDVDGNPVYLASSKYNLALTEERWENVEFRATREHGEVLA
jgi:peptide chain release factor 3